jgi:hypothetical protein
MRAERDDDAATHQPLTARSVTMRKYIHNQSLAHNFLLPVSGV